MSVGYVEKIRGQQLRTDQKARVQHRPGRKPEFTSPVQDRLHLWLVEQPDLTLGELQQKLVHQVRRGISLPSLWKVLGQMVCG